MLLSDLKAICAAYLQLDDDLTRLTRGGIDMFLQAANNVRRGAELDVNWEYSRIVAEINIDGVVGVPLQAATILSPTKFNTTFIATGTITPDVTGGFNLGGVPNYFPSVPVTTFNGFLFYTNPLVILPTGPSGPYFLYFNTAANSYVIATTLTAGALTDFFVPSVPIAGADGPIGDYVGQGAYTGTCTIAAPDPIAMFTGVKEVVACLRKRPDGTYIPLDFARADIPIERDRTELEFSDNLFPYLRYPSDAQINARGSSSSVIQRGASLFIYPHFVDNVPNYSFNIRLEAFGWLSDYTAATLTETSPPDFLVDKGGSWMQWAILEELNFLFQTYVPRQEGNVGTTTSRKEQEWKRLLDWNAYLVDSNTTRSR